jgi:hypothetical protein
MHDTNLKKVSPHLSNLRTEISSQEEEPGKEFPVITLEFICTFGFL